MKFNKRAQYAILLALYLSRSGTSSVRTVAENLKLSRTFLAQVACQMVRSGILTSSMGIGGGCALTGDPSVREVLISVGEEPILLESADKAAYRLGDADQRAFYQFAGNLSSAMDLMLRRRVKAIGMELAANEFAIMERLNLDGRSAN